MKEIKRLDKSNQSDFVNFNRIIRNNLQNPLWFMPFSEENMQHTFDEGNTLVVYGAFVDNVLGAISLFDTNVDEFKELSLIAGVSPDKKGAELGGSMVLPDFRGQNLRRPMCPVRSPARVLTAATGWKKARFCSPSTSGLIKLIF